MKISIKKSTIKSTIKNMFITILLFLFLFEIKVFSIVTTRKIAFLILFIYGFFHYKSIINILKQYKIKNIFLFIGLITILLTIYTTILNWGYYDGSENSKNNYLEPVYLVYIFAYVFLGSIILSRMVNNEEEFCKIIVRIMLFQALCIYIGFFNNSFNTFIYKNFYSDDGRFLNTVSNNTRIVGIQLGGADGSIALLIGMICCLYLMCFVENKKQKYLFCYLVILLATFLVGKTGAYIGLCGIIIFYLIKFLKNKNIKEIIKSIVLAFLFLAIVRIAYDYLILNGILDIHLVEFFLKWITQGSLDSIEALKEMVIPNLTFETFFGTGIMRGTTKLGTVVSHDSGYVMFYSGLGLMMSIVFYSSMYGSFFNIVSKIVNKEKKGFLICLILIMMFIETKEPFFLKYRFPFVLLTLSLLVLKNESFNKHKND